MKTHYAVAMAIASFGLGAAAVQGLNAQTRPPIYQVTEIDLPRDNVDAYLKEYAPKAQAITSTVNETATVTAPNDPPKCSSRPCVSTSQGPSPRSASSISTTPSAQKKRPTTSDTARTASPPETMGGAITR